MTSLFLEERNSIVSWHAKYVNEISANEVASSVDAMSAVNAAKFGPSIFGPADKIDELWRYESILKGQ